jgi:hypothetical protein
MCINKTTRNVTTLMLVLQDYKKKNHRNERQMNHSNERSPIELLANIATNIHINPRQNSGEVHSAWNYKQTLSEPRRTVSLCHSRGVHHWHVYQKWHVGKLANISQIVWTITWHIKNVLQRISRPRCEPLYATNTSHRKQETFLYEYPFNWVLLPIKRTLLFGSKLVKHGRHFEYWNQPLNMRMRVCYLDCHEWGLCCYLVIHIETLLHPLQLLYFHLWPIYWLSLVIKTYSYVSIQTHSIAQSHNFHRLGNTTYTYPRT